MLKAYTDGACRGGNPGFCSCAFVVYDGDLELVSQGTFLGHERHTNNFAEYQGLLTMLQWAHKAGHKGTVIHCDSLLVINQVTQIWQTRNDLVPYALRANALVGVGGHTLKHVRGHQGIVGNERADQICNQMLDENGY